MTKKKKDIRKAPHTPRGKKKDKRKDKKQADIGTETVGCIGPEGRCRPREQLSNLIFAYKFILTANKKLFLFRIPLLLLQTVKTVVPIFFVRAILNEITGQQRIEYAVIYAVSMAVLLFLLGALEQLLSKGDAREHEKLNFALQKLLADSVTSMSYATLEDPVMHDYIWLAQDNRFDSVLQYSTAIVGSIMTLLGIGIVVFSLNPLILAVIAAAAALRYIIERRRQRTSYEHNESRIRASRANRYYMMLTDDIQMGKEVRMNNLENWVAEMAETSWREDLYKADRKFTQSMVKNQSLDTAVSAVQEIAIYLILALEVIHSTMTVGDFSMYLTAAGTFSSCIIGISSNWMNLVFETSWYLRDYRYCLDYGERERKAEGSRHIDIPKNVEIEFRDVSFKYQKTDRMILEHVNITIRRGETLSIVGVNGAGKTTFVRLLCRFYEPTAGEIFVNGIPARDIALEDYYNLIGVVFQDFSLFSFTVAENISMDTEYDKKKLDDAIAKCGLESRIETLPCGVDTYIYKEFDPNGIELSGGEGQKVAIARAIYRDAPIIVFDEPTSALDPIAEYNIYRNFHELASGKTAIYISHRLSSTRFTDKTAVFANGTVSEYGTHDELMRIDGGIYKKMFSMQAKYYKD